MKDNISRAWWVVVIVLIAAVFLYITLNGRRSEPQDQDEFPAPESPPST